MQRELHNIVIPISKLINMPAGKILGAYIVKDMDDKDRDALKIEWVESYRGHTEIRIAHFAIDNGEYLGEACL